MILTQTSLIRKPLQQALIHLGVLWSVAAHSFSFGRQFDFSVEETCFIFSPATNHRLTDAVFARDLRVVLDSLCFGNYFKFESEIVRCATSFWHDDGLNLNEYCHRIVKSWFLNKRCFTYNRSRIGFYSHNRITLNSSLLWFAAFINCITVHKHSVFLERKAFSKYSSRFSLHFNCP